jgi:hypothetical protein
VIKSKPRHGEPIFERRGDVIVASPQFQRWMDDVTSQVNALESALEALEALEARVEALEALHP